MQDQTQQLIEIQQLQINGLFKQAVQRYIHFQNQDITSEHKYLVHLNLAICNLNMNILEESLTNLNQALEIQQDDWKLYLNLAKVNLRQQNYEQARLMVQKGKQLVQDAEIIQQLEIVNQKIEMEQPLVVESSKMKQKLNYEWHQNDCSVVLTFKYKIQSEKQVKVNIQQDLQTLEVSLELDKETESEFCLKLNQKIKDSYKVNVNIDNIEVVVMKEVEKQNWSELEYNLKESQNVQTGSFYPSSNKVKRNWDKIDKEIEKEIEKDNDGDAMNKLFKQIYGNADENTRRAMIKSFQTSGGTVLSTNWDEVKAKDYENKDRPDAPAGQKWGKWEQ